MGKTKIPWSDYTWNPVVGCTKVSEGCQNCYAEKMAIRLARIEQARKCKKRKYHHVVELYKKPPRWRKNTYCDRSALDKPLHWKNPRRIFVCSMGDLFHESVPFEFIDKVMVRIADCPQHTFQVLTKRPERMAEYFDGLNQDTQYRGIIFDLDAIKVGECWPLPNLWLGGSISNQPDADRIVPIILSIPAAKRFVSVEPMLSGLNIEMFEGKGGKTWKCKKCNWVGDKEELKGGNLSINCPICNARNTLGCNHTDELEPIEFIPKIDWLIIGCESGSKRRLGPIFVDEEHWRGAAIGIVDQCKSADIPVFVKQIPIKGKVVKDITKFPKDLQVREYPE